MTAWLMMLARLLLPLVLQWLLRDKINALSEPLRTSKITAFKMRILPHLRRHDMKAMSRELHNFICELDAECAKVSE